MANLGGFLLGGLQLIAGIFLVATGLGAGIGVKLILGGVLSIVSTLLAGKGRTGLDNDPRYGFDNAQNFTEEGLPVPVVFGRERFAGPIISVLFDTQGSTEVIKYLMVMSEGEIKGISDVRLNGSPAASLNAVIETRLGTDPQTIIPGFDRTGASYTAGQHLGRWTDCGGTPSLAPPLGWPCGIYVFNMKAAADEVVLRFSWPGGLYHFNNDGTTKESTATVTVWMKPLGAPDSAYVAYRCPVVNGIRQSGEWRSMWNADFWTYTKHSRNALRAVLRLPLIQNNVEGHPGPGRYTILVKGEGKADTNDPGREPDLVGWNEIQNAPASGGYTYPGCALLAVSVPASASISGGIPRTDAIVDGVLLEDFRTGGRGWSRNPVLAVYALITNKRWGLGKWITASDCDIGNGGTFRTMAERCDEFITPPSGISEARYELDLVMSTKAESRDWIQQILAGCRMTLLGVDGLLKIVEDREQYSVADFDERAAMTPIAPPPGEAAWGLADSAPITFAMTAPNATPPPPRANILADPDTKISSLVVRQGEESSRYSQVLIKYVDRDQTFRKRTLTLFDWRLNVAGAITGGPLLLGEPIKGLTSLTLGFLTAGFATGASVVTFTVAPNTSTGFVNGETVKGLISGATFVASGAAYQVTPPRNLEIQLYGLSRHSQVLREARYHLSNAQSRSLFASWGFARGDLNLYPGHVVRVYSDRLGWTAKAFTILSVAYDQFGIGRIEAREYSPAPFALVDRAAGSPFVEPGGSVEPGLRDPTPETPTTGSTTPPPSDDEPPASGGSSGGTLNGILQQFPLLGSLFKK